MRSARHIVFAFLILFLARPQIAAPGWFEEKGPVKPPPKSDPAWTPPPSFSGANWEKQTEKDWVDPRLRMMDTGPTFNATFDYPSPQGKTKVFKGTAIRIGDMGEAAVLFDRNQFRLAAGWTGKFLNHSDRRFGLLNTPTPAGPTVFTTRSGPGWADPAGKWEDKHPATAPLPHDWAQYKGMYSHGKRTVLSYRIGKTDVLESPWIESNNGVTVLTRTLQAAPSPHSLKFLACEFSDKAAMKTTGNRVIAVSDGTCSAVILQGDATIACDEKRVMVSIKESSKTRRVKVLLWQGKEKDLEAISRLAAISPAPVDLSPWTLPGPTRWTQPISTRGERGKDDGPFAVDTLTLPYDNPYKALMFVSGLDFLPNGDAALCTMHGDVWIVSGIDGNLEHLKWRRFATGLYQPLGLKVVDGKIIVLERGQLTRLHDRGGRGEADFYECFNNDWHTGGGEHSFDTCLETDPAGNFYFFKTGDADTPTGGCLLRVTKDGSKTEVFATGFRHPIGLGVSPDGMVTGADQEGNWMPMTRVDVYERGGFYGDMRTHHRAVPPKIYDGPMLWLPKEADNSAGGQVWVPQSKWGPLAGQMLHLSYGRCKAYLVMPQKVGDTWQAGAVDLGLFFLSGVMRGRFGPDGNLYVAGLRGWQTAARRDGCLQRVRYTGKPVTMPIGLSVHEDGVRLTFAEPLDHKTAEDPAKYHVEVCGYRWTANYGSKHWSVANPNRVGHDQVAIKAVVVAPDRKSVFLRLQAVKPVMQMFIRYDLRTAAGTPASGTVYNTIHKAAAAETKR